LTSVYQNNSKIQKKIEAKKKLKKIKNMVELQKQTLPKPE